MLENALMPALFSSDAIGSDRGAFTSHPVMAQTSAFHTAKQYFAEIGSAKLQEWIQKMPSHKQG